MVDTGNHASSRPRAHSSFSYVLRRMAGYTPANFLDLSKLTTLSCLTALVNELNRPVRRLNRLDNRFLDVPTVFHASVVGHTPSPGDQPGLCRVSGSNVPPSNHLCVNSNPHCISLRNRLEQRIIRDILGVCSWPFMNSWTHL